MKNTRADVFKDFCPKGYLSKFKLWFCVLLEKLISTEAYRYAYIYLFFIFLF